MLCLYTDSRCVAGLLKRREMLGRRKLISLVKQSAF